MWPIIVGGLLAAGVACKPAQSSKTTNQVNQFEELSKKTAQAIAAGVQKDWNKELEVLGLEGFSGKVFSVNVRNPKKVLILLGDVHEVHDVHAEFNGALKSMKNFNVVHSIFVEGANGFSNDGLVFFEKEYLSASLVASSGSNAALNSINTPLFLSLYTSAAIVGIDVPNRYETAEQGDFKFIAEYRDQVMSHNIKQYLSQTSFNQGISVGFVGQSHLIGLNELFKDTDISVVLVTSAVGQSYNSDFEPVKLGMQIRAMKIKLDDNNRDTVNETNQVLMDTMNGSNPKDIAAKRSLFMSGLGKVMAHYFKGYKFSKESYLETFVSDNPKLDSGDIWSLYRRLVSSREKFIIEMAMFDDALLAHVIPKLKVDPIALALFNHIRSKNTGNTQLAEQYKKEYLKLVAVEFFNLKSSQKK